MVALSTYEQDFHGNNVPTVYSIEFKRIYALELFGRKHL